MGEKKRRRERAQQSAGPLGTDVRNVECVVVRNAARRCAALMVRRKLNAPKADEDKYLDAIPAWLGQAKADAEARTPQQCMVCLHEFSDKLPQCLLFMTPPGVASAIVGICPTCALLPDADIARRSLERLGYNDVSFKIVADPGHA